MILQILFAILAGLITISSPCIIPILPIILSSALKKNKLYPVIMVFGMSTTFSVLGILFGAFGGVIGISRDILTTVSIFILLIMGILMVVDGFGSRFAGLMNKLFAKFSTSYSGKEDSSFQAFFLGTILGVVWAPCVGPILASILAIATSTKSILSGFILLFAYSMGAGIPMIAIAYGGRRFLGGQKFLKNNSSIIKKVFGWILIATAIFLYFGLFKQIEAFLIPYYPDFISSF